MGWIIGFWCLSSVIIGTFQKPTRRVSSVWALGLIIMLVIQGTVSWGIKGFLFSVVLGVLFLFVASAKYGLK
jgi:hypothetical protein